MSIATRKKAATARATKSRPRKLLQFGKSSTEKTVNAIRKDARLLLLGDSSVAVEKARDIITKVVVKKTNEGPTLEDKVLFLLSCVRSVKQFPGYATLDQTHIERINNFIKDVQQYIKDDSVNRPLNFLMLAEPGTGKSHFIKCIATRLKPYNVDAITFNMAGQRHEDLIRPLDAARNSKVQDLVPLLFLDEFDADESNNALLLPLLWDGELSLSQRDLKLGKVIIVLAGSHPNLRTTMDHARSMKLEVEVKDGRPAKLVDLLSRINGGVIEIPPFHDLSRELDRRFDKVCIAVQLLRNRFKNLKRVPVALLQFLALADFRYGSRSIAYFVNMIPYTQSEELTIRNIQLRIRDSKKLKTDSLAYHLLHDDQAHGVAEIWKKVTADDSMVPVNAETLDSLESLQVEGLPDFLLDYTLGQLVEELTES